MRKMWQWLKKLAKQLTDPFTFVVFGVLWVIVSGAGILVVGVILQNYWLIGVATTIIAFWVAPFTPLILLLILTSITITKPLKRHFKRIKDYRALMYRFKQDERHKRFVVGLVACLCFAISTPIEKGEIIPPLVYSLVN